MPALDPKQGDWMFENDDSGRMFRELNACVKSLLGPLEQLPENVVSASCATAQ